MSYDQIQTERQMLNQQSEILQARLKELPKGRLVCIPDGKYIKWYQCDDQGRVYISKKNRKLAEQLAEKMYISNLLDDIMLKINSVDSYLESHVNGPGKAERLLLENPEIQKLLIPYFSQQSNELSDWANAPYDSNPYYPEELVHKTVSGQVVRSKSEAMTVMLLHKYKIPFRYECKLTLGKSTLYPDFTILHPKTKQIYYWEHFGFMDDSVYSKNAASKIHTYVSHAIIPSINLITTYETKEYPLCGEMIEKIIRYYFL